VDTNDGQDEVEEDTHHVPDSRVAEAANPAWSGGYYLKQRGYNRPGGFKVG